VQKNKRTSGVANLTGELNKEGEKITCFYFHQYLPDSCRCLHPGISFPVHKSLFFRKNQIA